jgi:hypothetical protein
VPFESGNIPQETLDYLASKKKSGSDKSNGSGMSIVESICKFILGVGLLLVGGAVVLLVVGLIVGPANLPKVPMAQQSSSTAQDHPQAAADYKPAAIIAAAKQYIAAKNFHMAISEIGQLTASDAQRPGVQNMLARATQAAQLDDLKESRSEARSARIAYADKYERSLLEEGGDYTVRAEGPNADILSVKFVLINRPFVYNTENDHDLNATWTLLGFKSVRLGDGFDSSWSYKLKAE